MGVGMGGSGFLPHGSHSFTILRPSPPCVLSASGPFKLVFQGPPWADTLCKILGNSCSGACRATRLWMRAWGRFCWSRTLGCGG